MAKTIFCTNRRHYLWNGLYRVNVQTPHAACKTSTSKAGWSHLYISGFIWFSFLTFFEPAKLSTFTNKDSPRWHE